VLPQLEGLGANGTSPGSLSLASAGAPAGPPLSPPAAVAWNLAPARLSGASASSSRFWAAAGTASAREGSAASTSHQPPARASQGIS